MDIVFIYMQEPEQVAEKKSAEVSVRQLVHRAVEERSPTYVIQAVDLIGGSDKITKATASVLLKHALDAMELNLQHSDDTVQVYNHALSWASQKKRNLLVLDLKMRKAEALLALDRLKDCLGLLSETEKTLKKIDDKMGLVKLYYLESKVYYKLRNLPRAKSSLTLSRSTSTMVYCPPLVQAKMDLLNSMYLTDEREYKTAAAYALDAVEGFALAKDAKLGVVSVRYLLLMKIMENKPRELQTLLAHKHVSPYRKDGCVEMLCKVAKCVSERNLKKCNDIIEANAEEVSGDRFMSVHLVFLCDSLIDANVLKVIEPYSAVRVEYIAHALGFDTATIENRLRRMILDERIKGTIDQETMCLTISRDKPVQKFRRDTNEIMQVLVSATDAISQHAAPAEE